MGSVKNNQDFILNEAIKNPSAIPGRTCYNCNYFDYSEDGTYYSSFYPCCSHPKNKEIYDIFIAENKPLSLTEDNYFDTVDGTEQDLISLLILWAKANGLMQIKPEDYLLVVAQLCSHYDPVMLTGKCVVTDSELPYIPAHQHKFWGSTTDDPVPVASQEAVKIWNHKYEESLRQELQEFDNPYWEDYSDSTVVDDPNDDFYFDANRERQLTRKHYRD